MSKLSAEQYYEWRLAIEQMHHNETKLKSVRMMSALMEKDIEIQKLKQSLYKQTVKSQEDTFELSKKQYEELKSKIESQLGHSLSNCVIDEVTFEVKSLE